MWSLGAVPQSFPLVMACALGLLVEQENETWLCQQNDQVLVGLAAVFKV